MGLVISLNAADRDLIFLEENTAIAPVRGKAQKARSVLITAKPMMVQDLNNKALHALGEKAHAPGLFVPKEERVKEQDDAKPFASSRTGPGAEVAR